METTSLFRDCHCRKNYIHPAWEGYCNKCDAKLDSADVPDSRIDEVIQAYPEVDYEALLFHENLVTKHEQKGILCKLDAEHAYNLVLSVMIAAGVPCGSVARELP